jgi:DNA invertase Pin-like site-specific DNA recombinase
MQEDYQKEGVSALRSDSGYMTGDIGLPKAVLYLRSAISSDAAIAGQRQACQRRAHQLGATTVAEYVDVGSGLNADRPGLQRLLADLRAREDVAFVITADHARIARSLLVYAEVTAAIEHAGARLMAWPEGNAM